MRVVTDLDEMTSIMANGLYLDHHHYEEMARTNRGVARVNGWSGARRDREFGAEMAIAVYESAEGKPPVIAFGNTRLPDTSATESAVTQLAQLGSDLHEDLFPMGIGCYRYCYNEGRLKNLIEALVARYEAKVIVTGHSLGGTLAQLTAVRMPELVEAAVTFQSPSTTRGFVARLYGTQSPSVAEDLQCQSYHYKVVGDELIQEAGELGSPGELVRLTFVDGEIATPAFYYAHLIRVFGELGPTRGSVRAIRAIAERKLAQIELDTIGPPDGEVESTLTTGIEWLRSNALMIGIGIETLASRSPLPIVTSAVALLQEVIYCSLWTMNVDDFRDDPQTNVTLTDAVPGFPLRSLIPAADLRRMRSEFARYIRHSRIRG